MPILLDLRSRREARGWTQTELAKRSGVPQPAISRLERPPELGGQRSVDLEVLEKLADTLGIHPARLISIQRRMSKRQLAAANRKRRKRHAVPVGRPSRAKKKKRR
jgi:transcriptional regulator with XRE-family HTH domain